MDRKRRKPLAAGAAATAMAAAPRVFARESERSARPRPSTKREGAHPPV
jgi:hypothetical protein